MAINITSTKDVSVTQGVKCLIYGKAGVGKTTLASTAPAPLILSAESGLLSLRKFDLPVIEIKHVTDLIEIHRWLKEAKPDSMIFKTIYIDSITEIAEVVLANAKAQVTDKRQAYGELIEKMHNTLREFRDLAGRHVVMVAQQELIKDDYSGVVTYGPAMPGSKLGQKVPYIFDAVLRLAIGKTTEGVEYRYLQTRPDFQYEAKDRSGSLEAIEQPNLTYLFNKMAEK